MTPEQASIVAEFLLPQVEQEVQTTSRVMSAVPDDKKDYKPHQTCMDAGTLVGHMAASDIMFLEAVVNAEFGTPSRPPADKTTAEIAADYGARAAELLAQIKDLSGEHLAKPVTFYAWTLPCVAFLQFMQKHSVHHRGQLSAYLRPMGAKVPSIYGGSADENFTVAKGEGA